MSLSSPLNPDFYLKLMDLSFKDRLIALERCGANLMTQKEGIPHRLHEEETVLG
jgi:hypothetical protein